MTKITYLLGAGASANTIPVVSDMNQRIKEIVTELKSYQQLDSIQHIQPDRYDKMPESLKNENHILNEIISELDWLLQEAETYYSIDTLARKYYLTDDDSNYERLKKCLIFYFTLEQFIYIPSKPNRVDYSFDKTVFDKRYDSFISVLSTKAKDGLKLNNNVRVLTWNYDLQFDLSLKRYRERRIEEIKIKYQILPHLYFREPTIDNLRKTDEFSLIKLNGNAIFASSLPNIYGNEFHTVFDKHSFTKVSSDILLAALLEDWRVFDFHNNSACRFLNFVWEGNSDFIGRKYEAHDKVLAEAETIASETEILVVIGYSFPIFNRKLDNRIFSKMDKLRKVYIQDRDPDRIKSTMQNAFEILQRKKTVNSFGNEVTSIPAIPGELRQVDKVSFQLESNTSQFVIPYELN